MSTAAERAADRARITDIETQISNLKCSIEVLQTEMTRAQERLESYTYPVLTLPNEIVSEIFVHFLPVYPLCPPINGLESPTLLTHICRRWREIALATPALWRAISLTGDQDLHILESWLNRSRSLPLSLEMDTIFSSISEECLEKLALHAARWENAKLGLRVLPQLLTIPTAMPLLQELELRMDNGGIFPPVAYRAVPRLRAVTLWDFSYPADFLPWAQLTSLTMVNTWPADCATVLQHMVNLVHCELAMENDWIRPPDIKLERLESLVLMKFLDEDEPPTHYLETLITPALRTLQVLEGFLRPDPIHTLTSFISKSGCKLENIRIVGTELSSPTYREAFHSIPNLSFHSSPTSYYTLIHRCTSTLLQSFIVLTDAVDRTRQTYFGVVRP
ncbi:hypothetical protein FB451DRAFT_394297 [Mycena latifolia]|nr:hypothetical protein FB451DRAFT_394297 [Mycena latifolia]